MCVEVHGRSRGGSFFIVIMMGILFKSLSVVVVIHVLNVLSSYRHRMFCVSCLLSLSHTFRYLLFSYTSVMRSGVCLYILSPLLLLLLVVVMSHIVLSCSTIPPF